MTESSCRGNRREMRRTPAARAGRDGGKRWAWVASLFWVAGFGACAIDDRQVSTVQPALGTANASAPDGVIGPGAADGDSSKTGSGKALGVTCSAASDCGSGFCVDGVCCDTGCGEVCASCSGQGSDGACSPTANDESCPALHCPLETECRRVDGSQLGANCDGVGSCRKDAVCQLDNVESGTACQNGTGVCTGDGACAVPGKLVLGAACSADDQCAEGHCVSNGAVPSGAGASICCDTACDGECQQCNSAGHCDATPPSDPRCPSVSCPVDNVCRDYSDDLTAACHGFGACAQSHDCAYSELRPAADCSCDAAGSCTLLRGKECSDDTECASGACAPSAGGRRVCCASACADGLLCVPDGSGCVECRGAQVSCDGGVEQRCQADGNFALTTCQYGCTPDQGCDPQPGVGLPCAAGACAPGLVCQADVAGMQRCCTRDCAQEKRVCAANGSCVCSPDQPQTAAACLLHDGDPCADANACESGQCVDGVCCQEACDGACERCEPGSGACVSAAAAQPDPLCSADKECTGARGDCRSRSSEPCTADADCSSSHCAPAVTGGQRCCAEACSGGTSCSSDGARCVECEATAASNCGNGCDVRTGVCNPLRPIGSTCALPQQCAAPGVCLIDSNDVSRCCESNCAAQGKQCDTSGKCVCPANQVELAGQCRSENGQSCTDNSSCASNLCELIVGGGKRCCARACGATELCSPDGSTCIDQRGALGAPCSTGADCQNNTCVNAVCCSGACGPCQRCAQATGLCQPDPSAACTLASGSAGDCNAAGQCVDPGAGPGQLCSARPCQAGLVCTASGVCCASLCNGPCESACGAGSAQCNTPATDARCGQVQCTSPQCQSSRPLQTNRSCIGPGTCAAPGADQCSTPVAASGSCTLPGGAAGQCSNGACAPALRATGAACTQDSQCQLGFCTDGVCCQSRCNGVCAQCVAGSGACSAPADDPACGSISCGAVDCRNSSSLTGGRCRSLGVCKTALDCPQGSAVPDGTACGGTSGLETCFNGICNNSPAVVCNGAVRPITDTMICCESRSTGSFAGTPVEFYNSTANCPAVALDLIGTTPVTCDDVSDCAPGEVCCASSGRDSSAIQCLPASSCNLVNGGVTSFSVVCGSPGGKRSPCPQGTTCQANANLGAFVPGWSLCSISN